MTRFTGCGTALVTPMTPDGMLDLPAMERLVDWQIDEGIHFLVAIGSTGEAATLTPEERERVVTTVVQRAAGRVPVVAGATSNDTRAAARDARTMADAGADVILSATPYYNKPTTAGLERHFGAVCEAAGKPVIVYNVPGRTALNMSAATTLALARLDGVIGVKEASGDLGQMMAIILQRDDGFAVLSGDDAMTLALLAAGGDGVISVVSNEIPRQMSQLVDTALSGDFASARDIHYRLLPLMDANFVESNPIPVKWALHAMGRIDPGIRLPLVPLSEDQHPVVRQALDAAGVLPA